MISQNTLVQARLDNMRSKVKLSTPTYYKESGRENYTMIAPKNGYIKIEKNHYYLSSPQNGAAISESVEAGNGSGSIERQYVNEGYRLPPVKIEMGR